MMRKWSTERHIPAKMEKKPDRTAQPNDHDRKLESGLGSHCRSTSALMPNTVTEILMNRAGNTHKINNKISHFYKRLAGYAFFKHAREKEEQQKARNSKIEAEF